MPHPFLFLYRLALMAGATSILLAEGTLALATPAFARAGAALDLDVLATGTPQGAGITWTLTLLPAPPTASGAIQILCGMGSRIPFVVPALRRDGVLEIKARAGDATVTRQIRVPAAGATAPAPSAAPPPWAPAVRLAVTPSPGQVFAGTLVTFEARSTGGPRHMRPHWTPCPPCSTGTSMPSTRWPPRAGPAGPWAFWRAPTPRPSPSPTPAPWST